MHRKETGESMKVIYMGTPDFAVPALKKLHELGAEIPMVYTQPDRPKGRGKKLAPSPVKVAAEELGLPVRQPERLREAEEVEFLKSLEPDMILVAAYGQILPKSVLEIPAYGCINLHASLLPKYRGAAPVEAAILAGEKETGVTVMQMAEGLDTGDMLLKGSVPIQNKTCGQLHDELAEIGAPLGITRQAVRSLIKRTEDILLNYEEKLRFAERLGKMRDCFRNIEAAAEHITDENTRNIILSETAKGGELL